MNYNVEESVNNEGITTIPQKKQPKLSCLKKNILQ